MKDKEIQLENAQREYSLIQQELEDVKKEAKGNLFFKNNVSTKGFIQKLCRQKVLVGSNVYTKDFVGLSGWSKNSKNLST